VLLFGNGKFCGEFSNRPVNRFYFGYRLNVTVVDDSFGIRQLKVSEA
jgi:hypothetical protein